MPVATRSVALLGIAGTLALLSGCGVSSSGSGNGSGAIAQAAGSKSTSTPGASGFSDAGGNMMGTHNSIVATPQSNLVSVEVGQKQTVAVTFTSSDGREIQGFGLTNTSLPTNWTGPTNFGCARVDSGSSCVLNLVYAPTAYEIGKSVTLSYEYVDNSGTPVTNALAGASITMSFDYQGTTDDNVVNAVAPAGQVLANTNGIAVPVTVTFTTDDAHPASNLQITTPTMIADLTPPATPGCATISAGTPCVLTWLYQPTAPETGMKTFNYRFADDSGTAKSGSFNVSYRSLDDNSVTYTLAPSTNPLVVTNNSSQTVVVSFMTNDGYAASGFATVGDLSQLGASFLGWSAATSSLACATVDSGTGCQLMLTYSPTISGDQGTLQIPFNFTSNAGVGHSGTLNISYRAS